MATIYKRSTVATLGSNTAWDLTGSGGAGPAGPPGATDIAYWQAGSLGAALTGAISPQGIQVDGALTNIAHSTNTITLGTSGFTFGAANNRSWAETGVIAVGANNQTWALCNTTQGSNIQLNGAAVLTGSATINVTNNSGINDSNYAYVLMSGAQAGFTGTFVLNNYAAFAVSGASNLTAGNITVSGTGVTIYNANASGDTIGGAGKLLTVNNDFTIGIASRAFSVLSDVAFGSPTRTVTVNSSTATLSGAITGTAGFTKAGAGNLTLNGSLAGLTGSVAYAAGASNGYLLINSAASTYQAGLSFNLTGTTTSTSFVQIVPSFTNTFAFPAGFSATGSSAIIIDPSNVTTISGAGFSFPTGTFTNLTGTSLPTGAGATLSPGSGLTQYSYSNVVAGRTNIATIKEFPGAASGGVLTHWFFANSASITHSNTTFYDAAGASHTYPARLDLITGGTVAGTFNSTIYANQASGPLVLSGVGGSAVTRYSQTGSYLVTLTLRGSSAANVNNEISGTITETSGTIAITKADTNRWILSNNNSYTGANTVSAGTLSIQNTSGLGNNSANAVTVSNGATLELAVSGTINKSSAALNLNGTGVSSAGAINVPAGSYALTYSASSIVLQNSSSISVGSGSSLTLGAAITGAFALTKVAAGTLSLTNTGSSYTGKTTISAGTLEITRIANSGNNSSIGAPSVAGNITIDMAAGTTLKYSGTTLSTSDRSFNFTGPGSYTFDSSGTAAMNLSGTLTFASAGSNELVLTGTAAAGVTSVISSSAISNGSGTTSLTKNDSCRWRLDATGLTYTGNTTVNAGTLDLGSTADRSLSSNVVMAGGTLTNGAKSITPAASVTATTGSSTIESVIAGAGGTVTVNNGATLTLSPDTNLVIKTGTNTFTGNATVSAGGKAVLVTEVNAAAAGKGSVLGQSNTTTVAGTVCTSPTGNQAGTARYNNLTFQAGAVLKLGFTS